MNDVQPKISGSSVLRNRRKNRAESPEDIVKILEGIAWDLKEA